MAPGPRRQFAPSVVDAFCADAVEVLDELDDAMVAAWSSRWGSRRRCRGTHAFDGHLAEYRQYAVNHEVGHALGHGHAGCPADGALAPVMMQQTFGLSDTYVARLDGADPSAVWPVVADGKVCRANPWVRSPARLPTRHR
ncbi:DUF3152 domain-containing protein [Amycolatopsis sp. NPDC051372]|uniref:DUF3152 domain-containing protein n=1 Tax=unclassified Amycolatopsis TaxID=2618356 RepID=UPI003439BE0A